MWSRENISAVLSIVKKFIINNILLLTSYYLRQFVNNIYDLLDFMDNDRRESSIEEEAY